MAHVSLKKIDSTNWRGALALSVTSDQQAFVSSITPPVAMALSKAYIKPDGRTIEPLGIYFKEELAGFLNFHYTPGSKMDYWIFHFFIDQRFQRKGLGGAAINELIRYVSEAHPACEKISLTVKPENKGGLRFIKHMVLLKRTI